MNIKKTSRVTYIMAVLLVAVIVSVFAASGVSTGREQKVYTVKDTDKEKKPETADEIQKDWVDGTYSNIVGEIAAKIAEKGDYGALKKERGILWLRLNYLKYFAQH